MVPAREAAPDLEGPRGEPFGDHWSPGPAQTDPGVADCFALSSLSRFPGHSVSADGLANHTQLFSYQFRTSGVKDPPLPPVRATGPGTMGQTNPKKPGIGVLNSTCSMGWCERESGRNCSKAYKRAKSRDGSVAGANNLMPPWPGGPALGSLGLLDVLLEVRLRGPRWRRLVSPSPSPLGSRNPIKNALDPPPISAHTGGRSSPFSSELSNSWGLGSAKKLSSLGFGDRRQTCGGLSKRQEPRRPMG